MTKITLDITKTNIIVGVIIVILFLIIFTTIILNADKLTSKTLTNISKSEGFAGMIVNDIITNNFIKQYNVATSIPRKIKNTDTIVDITIEEDNSTDEKSYEQAKEMIDRWIMSLYITDEFGENDRLKEICHDSLSGGKRLRGIITYEIARSNGLSNIVNAVLAVEYIHASSLIVDDMPFFDNDVVRRGLPSMHIKYGQANALLASLVLLTGSFQCISRQVDESNKSMEQLIANNFISYFINKKISDLSVGQYIDITDFNATVNKKSDIINLIYKKTSSLFEIAVILGWVFTDSFRETIKNNEEVEDLYQLPIVADIISIGTNVGMCLQLADDICDRETDKNTPAKNYCITYGYKQTRDVLAENMRKAIAMLKKYQLYSSLWREIFVKIISLAKSTL